MKINKIFISSAILCTTSVWAHDVKWYHYDYDRYDYNYDIFDEIQDAVAEVTDWIHIIMSDVLPFSHVGDSHKYQIPGVFELTTDRDFENGQFKFLTLVTEEWSTKYTDKCFEFDDKIDMTDVSKVWMGITGCSKHGKKENTTENTARFAFKAVPYHETFWWDFETMLIDHKFKQIMVDGWPVKQVLDGEVITKPKQDTYEYYDYESDYESDDKKPDMKVNVMFIQNMDLKENITFDHNEIPFPYKGMKQKIKQHQVWDHCKQSNKTDDYSEHNHIIGSAWEQDQSFKMRQKSMTWDKMDMNIKYDIKQTSASIVCNDGIKMLTNDTDKIYTTNINGNQLLKVKRMENIFWHVAYLSGDMQYYVAKMMSTIMDYELDYNWQQYEQQFNKTYFSEFLSFDKNMQPTFIHFANFGNISSQYYNYWSDSMETWSSEYFFGAALKFGGLANMELKMLDSDKNEYSLIKVKPVKEYKSMNVFWMGELWANMNMDKGFKNMISMLVKMRWSMYNEDREPMTIYHNVMDALYYFNPDSMEEWGDVLTIVMHMDMPVNHIIEQFFKGIQKSGVEEFICMDMKDTFKFMGIKFGKGGKHHLEVINWFVESTMADLFEYDQEIGWNQACPFVMNGIKNDITSTIKGLFDMARDIGKHVGKLIVHAATADDKDVERLFKYVLLGEDMHDGSGDFSGDDHDGSGDFSGDDNY